MRALLRVRRGAAAHGCPAGRTRPRKEDVMTAHPGPIVSMWGTWTTVLLVVTLIVLAWLLMAG
jgi:hypothetical protein